MLTVAVEGCLHCGQRQRKSIRLREWRSEFGDWHFTAGTQHGGKDLDLSRRCVERAVAILLVCGSERHTDPPRAGPQQFHAEPAWCQMMIERRVDIAVPELLA